MTELSREMANWITQEGDSEVRRLMTMIERYFDEGDEPVISVIYSDFLATIIEVKKDVREKIRKMMGPETETHYKKLLYFYRERDM